MASWHYAFLFPGAGQKLAPANAVSVLVDFGLEFDNVIRLAVEIDEVGHLEHGDELKTESVSELQQRLTDDEQFLVECRNQEIFFSCSFATKYSNAYVMLGWPRRLFGELGEARQNEYWRMLRQFAKQCNSTYVVVVNDPPDYFEDRFLEIDGQRILDKTMPSGNKYDIVAVWRNAESSDGVPEGVDGEICQAESEGFLTYSVY